MNKKQRKEQAMMSMYPHLLCVPLPKRKEYRLVYIDDTLKRKAFLLNIFYKNPQYNKLRNLKDWYRGIYI